MTQEKKSNSKKTQKTQKRRATDLWAIRARPALYPERRKRDRSETVWQGGPHG